MTRFVLDSGDPDEYRELIPLFEKYGKNLWGSTTNPTLIAKKIGKKLSQTEANELQKKLVLEILSLVPGAVSAEVFADNTTSGKEMAEQGRGIAAWDSRVFVKLPTTIEGFKARTLLRKEKIPVNNTLVFSQEQIYAICLHEYLCLKEFGTSSKPYPMFISPFVGRLDDVGEDGMSLVENGMRIKSLFNSATWMLEASVRSSKHINKGIELESELITAPGKVYKEWLENNQNQDAMPETKLLTKPKWEPDEIVNNISTIETFMSSIEANLLDIKHELTDKGLIRFAEDWNSILL